MVQVVHVNHVQLVIIAMNIHGQHVLNVPLTLINHKKVKYIVIIVNIHLVHHN